MLLQETIKRRAWSCNVYFYLFFEGFGEYLFSLLVYVVFSGNMLSVKYIIGLCSIVEMGNPLRMRVKPETKGRASEREKSGVEKVGILVLVIIVRKEFASTCFHCPVLHAP